MRYKDMNYVSNIAESLLSRPGCVPVLGPDIYTTIAEWEKKEIPLPIVIISIDEVCGSTGNGPLKSIDGLQAVVSRNFRTWLVSGNVEKAAAA